MCRSAVYTVLALLASMSGLPATVQAVGSSLQEPMAAPEFTHSRSEEWINSAPLRLRDLRGKVVLLEVWTFGCWNCYRSFPWLKVMEQRLKPLGLQVIGVHSPEFEHERVRVNIETKVREFGLTHPVMIDNDFSYWRALGNRYWPAFYVIDKNGNLRARFAGETHEGDAQATRIEEILKQLLFEPSPPQP
jgi:glutathione peroxidase-family protein